MTGQAIPRTGRIDGFLLASSLWKWMGMDIDALRIDRWVPLDLRVPVPDDWLRKPKDTA